MRDPSPGLAHNRFAEPASGLGGLVGGGPPARDEPHTRRAAGRGASEPGVGPQDGARVVTDPHTLLHRAGVTRPYLLAGHSFGGLYVRIFGAHYPDEVAGLVLIGSTASSQRPYPVIRAPAPSAGGSASDGVGRFAAFSSLAARVGLAGSYGDLVGGTLPARSKEELQYDTAQASTVRSVAEEYLRGGASAQQAASLPDFGDKPLFVLTAGKGHPASWFAAAQRKSTALSTNSAHEVVHGAKRWSAGPSSRRGSSQVEKDYMAYGSQRSTMMIP